MDKKIIEKAKSFAMKSNRSLSEIVETYLDKITKKSSTMEDEELNDIFGIISLDETFDEKEEVRKLFTNKHL